MAVNPKLLELLVCPKCKGDLVLTEKSDGLICHACRLMYEIRDDIPIMLIDEAIPLAEKEEETTGPG
ncbi:MAG: Trm112 family protein [Deltaproteobacteria bacterium]|nr:Trm112 family protein [Deltaproteobacteria bacterium]